MCTKGRSLGLFRRVGGRNGTVCVSALVKANSFILHFCINHYLCGRYVDLPAPCSHWPRLYGFECNLGKEHLGRLFVTFIFFRRVVVQPLSLNHELLLPSASSSFILRCNFPGPMTLGWRQDAKMPQISPGNDGTFGGVRPPKLTELRSGLPAQAKNDGTFHLASKMC